MKLTVALCLSFAIASSAFTAQDHATSPSVQIPAQESKKARQQREKMLKAQEKRESEQAAWQEETRPPEPPYPNSLRADFVRATAQAVVMMDNAANAIPKSRMEFAIANQSSIQYGAALAAATQNEGERQVAAILYAYSQKIPQCQELAWDAVRNVMTLALQSADVRACNRELQRLRAQADRTFVRNSTGSTQ